MLKTSRFFLIAISLLILGSTAICQDSTTKKSDKKYKNVIRYNLTGGLLFGINRYVVFGYERVVGQHQSFSVNFGPAGLPKFVSINLDSLSITKDLKNNGYNFSFDYRFYLAKENRYAPPHGLYIGPFASYNHFKRENNWELQKSGSQQELISTNTTFNITTIGGELGYQFVIWKRLAIDMVLIGPGFSYYDLTATIQSGLSDAQK